MKQSLINRLTRLNLSLQVKRIKRDISGVILLDKPLGFSSNQALQKIKYLLQAEKAGHTGSLDPLASGLLPLCFGEATKFSHYLLDADKSYRALVQLGATTTTGDAEGEVLVSQPVDVAEAQIKKVLNENKIVNNDLDIKIYFDRVLWKVCRKVYRLKILIYSLWKLRNLMIIILTRMS